MLSNFQSNSKYVMFVGKYVSTTNVEDQKVEINGFFCLASVLLNNLTDFDRPTTEQQMN